MTNQVKNILKQFELLTGDEQEAFIELAVKSLAARKEKEAMEEINKIEKQMKTRKF